MVGLSGDGDSWGRSRQRQVLGLSPLAGLAASGLPPPHAQCPQVPSCHIPHATSLLGWGGGGTRVVSR